MPNHFFSIKGRYGCQKQDSGPRGSYNELQTSRDLLFKTRIPLGVGYNEHLPSQYIENPLGQVEHLFKGFRCKEIFTSCFPNSFRNLLMNLGLSKNLMQCIHLRRITAFPLSICVRDGLKAYIVLE